jgi:hypothetical protein
MWPPQSWAIFYATIALAGLEGFLLPFPACLLVGAMTGVTGCVIDMEFGDRL